MMIRNDTYSYNMPITLEEQICQMSATDTFMLLACIYSHDYGMVQTFNKVYGVLGSSQFEKFLMEKQKDRNSLEREEASDFIDAVMDSEQMKKCVAYIMKKRFSRKRKKRWMLRNRRKK